MSTRTAAATLIALVAATLPVLCGAILLVSAAVRRPLLHRIGRATLPTSGFLPGAESALMARITVVWGIALVFIGALQGASELLLGFQLTRPRDLLIRTIGALALEAVLLTSTIAYLRAQTRGKAVA